MVKFNFTVQQAAEHTGVPFVPDGTLFGNHDARPRRMQLNERVPYWGRDDLRRRGYTLEFALHLGADHGDLDRSRARVVLGRGEQLRRGLRDRVVSRTK